MQLGFVHDAAASITDFVAVAEVACGGLQVGVLHLRGMLRRSIAGETGVEVAMSRPLLRTQCASTVVGGKAFVGIEFWASGWIQSIRVHVKRW